MKVRALISIIPVLLLASNYEYAGDAKTIYFQSLKFLTRADSPQKVKMIRTDHTGGIGKIIEEGILFSYKNRGAKRVYISGSFSEWKPMKMIRSDTGIWYYFLNAGGGKRNVTYKYLVDGSWIMDPSNPERTDDRMGSYLSVAGPVMRSEGRQLSYRNIDAETIEFRTYRPHASFVSIVGDFNSWNPENDLLTKGRDGIWRIQKKLSPGLYRYKYVIDGEWVPDIYNGKSASDNTGEICSIIKIGT
jgi:1,4-alpha-glucan branching enzyme